MGAGLAKILDKAFVLGFVLPTLLFAVTLLAEFGCPAWLRDTCSESAKNPFAELTYALLGVYVVAVLLLAINYALYRILEGYVPPMKWFGWRLAHHKRRFRTLQNEIARLGDDPRGDVALWGFRKQYPTNKADVLPTSFGNAIRAFEVYPRDVYGADSISVWPRLLTVVPKEVQGLINDAKALVDLCVNLCLLSTVVALSLLGRIAADVYRARVLHQVTDVRLFIAGALIFGLVAVAAYRFAVTLVPDWGEHVKSAFDCYLGTLATQLGYALPPTRARRIEFWTAFSQTILYGQDFDVQLYRIDGSRPHGKGEGGSDDDGADDEDGHL